MNKKQVLYADNDRVYLDTRCEFLELEGYQVFKAYSPEEARAVLERENIHLLILDIRLVDDNDEGDISGILLAKEDRWKRVPKVFVTGFPTFEAVREAYGTSIGEEPIAHAFLAKHEGPEPLVKAVGSIFENLVGINWKLQVAWDEEGRLSFPYLALLLGGERGAVDLAARSSELHDLVCKLFPADEGLSFLRLDWRRDGCVCLTAFASAKGVSHQAIVVLGPWNAVDRQRKGAERYCATESAPFGRPAFAESLRYAGLAYALPDKTGGLLLPGTSLFYEWGDKTGRLALESLYARALHGWHERDRCEKGQLDLAALYRERLGFPAQRASLEEARRRLHDLARDYSLLKGLSFSGEEIEVVFNNGSTYRGPDPLASLFDPGAFPPQDDLVASTFGGVSAKSLLVDEEGNVYPTDFEGQTQSPLFEDYISIESEFHFSGIPSLNLLSLWDFEKQLSESNSLNDAPPVGNVEPECRKALAAIQTVRKLAAGRAGDRPSAYLTGLFHYMLVGLLSEGPQPSLAKYQAVGLLHRLVAASLCLSQLDRIAERKASVPDGQGTQAGLDINEAGREVSVDGKEVRLTQTEFRLLLYLYQHPNLLCTREKILADVFEIKGTPTKSDKGLLNTHMDRLRKKIDLHPKTHRYIVTIRGEGYLLDLKP